MKKLYHGTTYENYLSILKNGFKPDHNSAWRLSDSHYVFFWDEEYKSRGECFIESIWNALYTAVINDYQGTGLAVLELEVPSGICHKDHTIDWEYQKSTAVNFSDISLDMVSNVYVNHKAYNKYLRWYYFCFHMCEHGCLREDFMDDTLWEALMVMRDSIDYKTKTKNLEQTILNLDKYVEEVY